MSYLGQYPTDEYAQRSAPHTPRETLQWDQHQQPVDFDQQVIVTPTQLHQPPPAPPTHQTPQQPVVQRRGTHDMAPVRLLPPGRSPPVEITPVMLDTTARPTARPASRARHSYHPYPSSAARREAEAHHHVRFPSQSSSTSHPVSPVSARPTFTNSRLSEFVPQGPSPPFMEGATVLPPAADERRYIIRADTYYDPGTQILTALLELPGVKKQDLRISLSTTLFNRQRQVTIQGYSRAFFPPSASALRERKYGRFTRNFPVPEDTRPEDIDAAMEDGVLVLRINCGVPATNADEHEIPIR